MNEYKKAMKIRVEIKNKILGDAILWEGDHTKIEEITHMVARSLAYEVIVDGTTKKMGMWVVSVVDDDE